MVGERGFEPPTPWVRTRGSASVLLLVDLEGFDRLQNHLQRFRRPFEERPHLIEKVGERGRNRTFNLLIKSQLLCQLSYAPEGENCGRVNSDYSIRGLRALHSECARG